MLNVDEKLQPIYDVKKSNTIFGLNWPVFFSTERLWCRVWRENVWHDLVSKDKHLNGDFVSVFSVVVHYLFLLH